MSAEHDINALLGLLKVDGTLIQVGATPTPLPVSNFALIMKRVKMGGSVVGGISETQEMLDFCGKHNIVSEVEVVPVSCLEMVRFHGYAASLHREHSRTARRFPQPRTR